MKKLILTLSCLLWVVAALYAQEPTTTYPYLYPQFTDGTVVLDGGKEEARKLNIHLRADKLHYIDGGIIKEVFLKDVNAVKIGNDVFVPVYGSMMKVVAKNDNGMVVVEILGDFEASREATGAYGTSSTSSATMKLTSVQTDAQVNQNYMNILNEKDHGVPLRTVSTYYIFTQKLKVKAARTYAKCLGVAFQIRDDIFDYEENAEIGKPVGLDLKEKKITLPLLGALAKAGEERGREIRRKLCRIDDHPEYGGEIIEFVKSEGGIEYARKRLYEYVDNARIALRPFGNMQEVEMLGEIAEFTADRKS